MLGLVVSAKDQDNHSEAHADTRTQTHSSALMFSLPVSLVMALSCKHTYTIPHDLAQVKAIMGYLPVHLASFTPTADAPSCHRRPFRVHMFYTEWEGRIKAQYSCLE